MEGALSLNETQEKLLIDLYPPPSSEIHYVLQTFNDGKGPSVLFSFGVFWGEVVNKPYTSVLCCIICEALIFSSFN